MTDVNILQLSPGHWHCFDVAWGCIMMSWPGGEMPRRRIGLRE